MTASAAFAAGLVLLFVITMAATGGGDAPDHTSLPTSYARLLAADGPGPLVYRGNVREPELSVLLEQVADAAPSDGADRSVVFSFAILNRLEEHSLPANGVTLAYSVAGTPGTATATAVLADGDGSTAAALRPNITSDVRATFALPAGATPIRLSVDLAWPNAGAMSAIIYDFVPGS